MECPTCGRTFRRRRNSLRDKLVRALREADRTVETTAHTVEDSPGPQPESLPIVLTRPVEREAMP
jgi:hypothetical protein